MPATFPLFMRRRYIGPRGRMIAGRQHIWRLDTVPSTVIHRVVAYPLGGVRDVSVDVYLRVRRAVMVEGMSVREASRVFGLHRDTVRKMLAYSVPPGYRRKIPPRRPKLEAYTGVIDRILEDDGASQEAKTHGQARLRAAEGRVWVRRRVHHRQGLRQGASPNGRCDRKKRPVNRVAGRSGRSSCRR